MSMKQLNVLLGESWRSSTLAGPGHKMALQLHTMGRDPALPSSAQCPLSAPSLPQG